MFNINYIKTEKGYIFRCVDEMDRMFYCSDLNMYAFFKSWSDYMIDAGSQEEMIYAGKVVEAY